MFNYEFTNPITNSQILREARIVNALKIFVINCMFYLILNYQ